MGKQQHCRQDDRAEGIDMAQRIQRDPAALIGGVVAQPIGGKPVGRLMQGNGESAPG